MRIIPFGRVMLTAADLRTDSNLRTEVVTAPAKVDARDSNHDLMNNNTDVRQEIEGG